MRTATPRFVLGFLLAACQAEVDPGDPNLPLGADCSSDSDCASGFCAESKCSSCNTDADCPPTAECTFSDSDQHHICVTPAGRVLGEPCDTRADCASTRCFDTGSGSVCSTCDVATDCPGQECRIDDVAGYARCQDAPLLTLGETCATPTQCDSGHCRDLVCADCTLDGDCVDGTCAFDATDGYASCVPDPGTLGAACTVPSACASGHCRDDVCAECTLDDDCTGTTCTWSTADGYAVCVPIPSALGDPCSNSGDCASMFCFDPGGGFDAVCSECEETTCATNQDCMFDAAVGYGACRGTLVLGASCATDSECLSGACNTLICSLCASSSDCFNETRCAHKDPEGYALCFDTSEELVNADFSTDGVFERVGCNGDCNGCVCDADGDGGADGFCVGEDCAVPAWDAPVMLDCDIDTCTTDDRERDAFTICDTAHSGLACATAVPADTDAFYVQEGMCICFGAGMCQCQAGFGGGGGDLICLDNGIVLHGSEAPCSADGVPCDDTYDGNFDPAYGLTDSGACQPAVCTDERVDVERDGSFSWCGCDHGRQGVLCHQDGDASAVGLCAGDACVETPPVSRACWREQCDRAVESGCAAGGQACDASFLRKGQTDFVHEGYCANVGNTLACVTSGHVCRAANGTYYDDCGDCADDDACDATLTDGAFDGSFGACANSACVAHVFPSRFDWRDYDGGDWTTPVANQQQVGACTVFGAVSAIEARWNIQNGDPTLDINLAEQDPVSCGGWSTFGAFITLDYARDTGIPDEACFPWANDSGEPCANHCADIADRQWTISDSTDVDPYRNHGRLALVTQGPVVARMVAGGMAKDASGIYYCPVSTGGHAVAVVGWDDVDGYWIVKNSWGPGWNAAESGFFRLYYGECDLSFEYSVNTVIPP